MFSLWPQSFGENGFVLTVSGKFMGISGNECKVSGVDLIDVDARPGYWF